MKPTALPALAFVACALSFLLFLAAGCEPAPPAAPPPPEAPPPAAQAPAPAPEARATQANAAPDAAVTVGTVEPGAITPPIHPGDYQPTGKLDSHLVSVTSGWLPASGPPEKTMVRYYFVYVPASYKSGTPAPLVVVLHGGGLDFTTVLMPTCHTSACKTANKNVEGYGYMSSVWATSMGATPQSLADQYGILVAVPNGANHTVNDPTTAGKSYDPNLGAGGNTWNDCTGNFVGYPPSGTLVAAVDDVAFITQMIQKMERPATGTNPGDGYSIDTSRIYVTGASNGGDMAHRLAREMGGPQGVPGVAAAAFSLAGDGATSYTKLLKVHLVLNDTCKSTLSHQANPVPLWMIKGQYDNFTKYYGGNSIVSPSWYIPYEPFLAGYPGTSNTQNALTDGNVTFMSQTLGRYGLSGTKPKTTLALNTNPHPLTPTPAGIVSNLEATTGTGASMKRVDSLVNCDVYSGNTRSQVSNCVATYAGHIEPSWAVPASNLSLDAFGAQNLDIDTATEQWSFFHHFTMAGYLP